VYYGDVLPPVGSQTITYARFLHLLSTRMVRPPAARPGPRARGHVCSWAWAEEGGRPVAVSRVAASRCHEHDAFSHSAYVIGRYMWPHSSACAPRVEQSAAAAPGARRSSA
jgi:hypothetical protein